MTANSQFKWNRIPVLNDNYIWLIQDVENNINIAVDPALSKPVIDFLEEKNFSLSHILVTHHHFDHVGGIKDLKTKYGCQIIGSKKDSKRIPDIDIEALENDTVEVGDLSFKVFEADGHTIGHILYLEENLNWAFVGDTLFAMGCGRMFEGTPDQFESSLRKIKSWNPDTLIFCAHEYTLSNAKFAISVEPKNQILQERLKDTIEKRDQNTATVPFKLKTELETNPFLRLDSNEILNNIEAKGLNPPDVFHKLRSKKDNF
jgi:hydroxyacylglutathione hydrolase